MKYLVLLSMIAISSTSFAQNRNLSNIAENNLKVALGLDRGAVNMGAEYESRSGSTGYSGYFMLATEKDSVAKPQIITLGGGLPIYIFDNQARSVYVTPGFGLNMIKLGSVNETTIGAQLKLGALFRLNNSLKIGFEHWILTNWLNTNVAGATSLSHIIVNFSL